MPTDLDNVPRIVKNESFYLFARLCMIVATIVGAPAAGYMLTRVIAQADTIASQVQEQSISVKVLTATVNDRLSNNLMTLSDHELRLRALEKR